MVAATITFAPAAMADQAAPTTDAGTLDAAAAARAFSPRRPYSPYAGQEAPRRPFFGDTHLHTSFSLDAGAFGAKLGPADAYRLARGEEVLSSTGQSVRLSRPLDFLIVTDHSDHLGFFANLAAGKPEVLADATARQWYNMLRAGQGARASLAILDALAHGRVPAALACLPGTRSFRTAWEAEVDAAERYNAPGHFTAMLGFEWTATPGGDVLHRNVVFRDGGDRLRQVDPFTSSVAKGSDEPADLWKWMGDYETRTGGQVFAIPHGGNLSNGRMFSATGAGGKKLDAVSAAARARWEPLYELTETAGDSETHPVLSPDDEFAAFERWDKGNGDLSVARKDEMLAGEYARAALKKGLSLARSLGVDPFRFGFAGGSDAHTGLAAVEENNFFGRTTAAEPSVARLRTTYASNATTGLKIADAETSAAGYTVVWATENTRASLWDAMKRRETYATTGSRMVVRLFGGWDFEGGDVGAPDLSGVGYRKGVPMGGELADPPEVGEKIPTFLVSAQKDPVGGNLDRYQIVKGWIDTSGEVHERIYDVAVSGGRKIGPDGRCREAVGNTVNVGDAQWTNTIGASELVAFWKDPEFDPAQAAFYYGRVLEIPTPRWTAYDLARLGNDTLEGTLTRVTERAYTSPIWYDPPSPPK